MKLSKITLSLIATGLHTIAEAFENMASEADTPSTAAVADKSEKVEQSSEKKSSGSKNSAAEKDDDLDDDEEEETADEKKKRLRKEKRQAKKAAEKKAAEKAAEESEDDDSFLDDEDEKITKDEVKKALVALAKAEGNPAAKAILTKYKAANVSQIDAGDYEAVMTDIAEAQE